MSDRGTTAQTEATERLEEHRRLADKHRRCEQRLAELRGKLLLSEGEKVEEVTLKKQKLVLKDRMEAIARSAGSAGSARSG